MTTTGRTPDQPEQPQTPTDSRPVGDRSASAVARIQGWRAHGFIVDEVTFVEIDLTAFNDAVARARESVERFLDTCRRARLGLPQPPPADPRARALWLRQNRNTGPAQRQRAPRRLDTTARRSRRSSW